MLEAVLEAELSSDRARVRISRMNRFGIVMLTRKRARQSIYGRLTDTCSSCEGTGFVRSATDIAVETLHRVRRSLKQTSEPGRTIRVSAPARVAAVLRGQLGGVLDDLAEQHGVEIVIDRGTLGSDDDADIALHPKRD